MLHNTPAPSDLLGRHRSSGQRAPTDTCWGYTHLNKSGGSAVKATLEDSWGPRFDTYDSAQWRKRDGHLRSIGEYPGPCDAPQVPSPRSASGSPWFGTRFRAWSLRTTTAKSLRRIRLVHLRLYVQKTSTLSRSQSIGATMRRGSSP